MPEAFPRRATDSASVRGAFYPSSTPAGQVGSGRWGRIHPAWDPGRRVAGPGPIRNRDGTPFPGSRSAPGRETSTRWESPHGRIYFVNAGALTTGDSKTTFDPRSFLVSSRVDEPYNTARSRLTGSKPERHSVRDGKS